MLWQNWSVRIGASALIVLLGVSILAPWLGTVDPTLFDAASRDLRPGAAVDTVMIAGRIVMRNRALTSIDEEELKANLVEKARTARERSGIPEESRWPVH